MLTNQEVLQSKRETITDNMNKSLDERQNTRRQTG